MWAALWSRVQWWALVLAGAVAVLFGAYAAGGRAARRAAELERTRSISAARRSRDEALAENERLDDSALRERARERMRREQDRG